MVWHSCFKFGNYVISLYSQLKSDDNIRSNILRLHFQKKKFLGLLQEFKLLYVNIKFLNKIIVLKLNALFKTILTFECTTLVLEITVFLSLLTETPKYII